MFDIKFPVEVPAEPSVDVPVEIPAEEALPKFLSRFSPVNFDKLANETQKGLRKQFMEIEDAVSQGQDVSDLLIKVDIAGLPKEVESLAFHTMFVINEQRNSLTIPELLAQVDVLYTLVGKKNRLDCAKRIGLID
jgi:hypothetical protein